MGLSARGICCSRLGGGRGEADEAVTNGTGFWQGLVKKGEGTLDYNSQLDGAYLDLQEGTVKFNTQYREKYSGDFAQYAPVDPGRLGLV